MRVGRRGARPRRLLAEAYLRRIVGESRLALLLPLALLLFLLVIPLVAVSVEGARHVNGRAALESVLSRLVGVAAGHGALGLAVVLLVGPAEIGIVSAVGGALGARGFVSGELASGGFETTLAAGWRPREVATGLLGAAWALVVGLWATCTVLVAALVALVAWATSVRLHPTSGYLAMALAAPLAVALGGVALGVVVALLAPGLARPGFGVNIGGGDLVSLVSLLPVLGLLLGMVLSGGAVVPVLIGAAGGAVCLGGLASVLGRAVRAGRLLAPSS